MSAVEVNARDGSKVFARIEQFPGGVVYCRVEVAHSATSFMLLPAFALALAEALEEVARPMIEGGPATFRDAMESALGGGE